MNGTDVIHNPGDWVVFWGTFAATALVLTVVCGAAWLACRPAAVYRRAVR